MTISVERTIEDQPKLSSVGIGIATAYRPAQEARPMKIVRSWSRMRGFTAFR